MKVTLTIAGSDSSGGAGIQADLKTMCMNGVYGESVITAFTAQNTTGVRAVLDSTPDFLEAQLDAVFEDIYPDSIKIGMVSQSALIHVIATKLQFYHAKNIVLDPVMVATSGAKLISDEAIDTLKKELISLADLITPNIPEAEVLAEMKIKNGDDMIQAAKKIYATYGCAVLCKGGHKLNDANDLLYINNSYQWFYGQRITNNNTHGTGCTLSSAIAANLAKGFTIQESIQRSKDYLSLALSAMLDLGQGSGPMMHNVNLTGIYKEEAHNE